MWGGGGAGVVFVAGKLFISTGLGGALNISHFITRLYRTVPEVNYLFHAESARNYFKKSSLPPWKLNGAPLSIGDIGYMYVTKGYKRFGISNYVHHSK